MRRRRAPVAILACVVAAAAYAVTVRAGAFRVRIYDLDYRVHWGVRNPSARLTASDP